VGSKLKRLLKTLLKFAVTAAALYFVLRKINVADILELYRQSNLFYILAALVAFSFSKLVSAIRLNMFFSAIGLKLDEKTNIRLYLLGMFYNLFLPGGIGGDGYKIYLLQKTYQTGTKKIFGAMLADRLSGMVALVVLALAGVSFLDTGSNWSLVIGHWSWVNLAFLLLPFVFLAYYLFIKWVYPYFLKVNLVTYLYAFAVQLLQVACAWLLLLALGETENHLAYIVIFLVSSAVAVLPISIGGVGVRELTFLYGSQLLNVDINIAVGISFLFYLITALVSLGGVWFVFRPVNLKLEI